MENEHGFIYAHNLDTYRRSKKERVQEQLREKLDTKDERRQLHKKRDRKTKGASTTNVEKTKNKAFNMLLPKRAMERDNRGREVRGRLYKKDKNQSAQMGHFNKNTRQKITSKKRRYQQ